MDLIQELEELLTLLEQERVPYALAGGLALAVHGIVRATADIDLLVPREAVEPLGRIARARGFRGPEWPNFASGLERARFTKFAGEEALLLDLLLAEGILRPVFEQRLRLSLGELWFWVVSRQGLKTMKLASGREIDLQDVRRLEELEA